jgi:hypothetical protein
MDQPLPPEAWRSEAFAEDLAEPEQTVPNFAPKPRWHATLLGLLPLSLATASASMLAVLTKV